MRDHAVVLDVVGIRRIEAFQVLISNDVNQSVGRIIRHVIDIGDARNHHFRCFDMIGGGIKS